MVYGYAGCASLNPQPSTLNPQPSILNHALATPQVLNATLNAAKSLTLKSLHYLRWTPKIEPFTLHPKLETVTTSQMDAQDGTRRHDGASVCQALRKGVFCRRARALLFDRGGEM